MQFWRLILFLSCWWSSLSSAGSHRLISTSRSCDTYTCLKVQNVEPRLLSFMPGPAKSCASRGWWSDVRSTWILGTKEQPATIHFMVQQWRIHIVAQTCNQCLQVVLVSKTSEPCWAWFKLIQDRTCTRSFEETVLSIGAASSTSRDRGRSGARPETL